MLSGFFGVEVIMEGGKRSGLPEELGGDDEHAAVRFAREVEEWSPCGAPREGFGVSNRVGHAAVAGSIERRTYIYHRAQRHLMRTNSQQGMGVR